MFTLTTLLVRNGYLAENKVLPKTTAGQSELGLCKLYVFSYTNNVYIEKIIKCTVTSSSSSV